MKILVNSEIHRVTRNDKVEKNKWELVWRITNSFTPHRTEKPYWFYIHEVFEDGVIDEGYDYPKCAIQRKDLKVLPTPFELDDNVVADFKKTVQEDDIAKYLIQNGKNVFSLAYSQKGIPILISRMKEYLANKANSANAKKRRTDLRR